MKSLLLLPFLAINLFAGEVWLAWDPSPSELVAGYKIYYGTSSRLYQYPPIAERQRELEAEKAKLYEDLYRAVTKKAGVGCRILRALTLGIHRCGGM